MNSIILKSHETSRIVINNSSKRAVDDGQVNLVMDSFSERSLDNKSGDCTLTENNIVMFERDNNQSAIDENFPSSPGSGDETITLSKVNSGVAIPTLTTSNYTSKIHPLKIEISQNTSAQDYASN